MHGPAMKLNGMTEMGMVEETTQWEQLLMFARMCQALPKDRPKAVTDGDVTTLMAMVGQTKVTDSCMSLLNGVIWMATALEIIPTGMKEMPAPMKEASHSSTG